MCAAASAAVVDQAFQGRFYGVYLLCSQSPEKRFNGKCYVGFTVNPNRRIGQHNRGIDFGAARRTNNKGPWKMVMIVHGFPNNIAALQFEWAWQQPALSTRLKSFPELKRKKPKETFFQYNFRILSRMLLVGPWNRLPLIVRWLETDYECDFDPLTLPPSHMEIVSGKIAIAKTSKKLTGSQPCAIWAQECHLCMQKIENPESSRIGCLNSLCKLTCHIICLANFMLSGDLSNSGHYIPISGECPLCETKLTWVALLQRKKSLQGVPEYVDNDEDDDEDEIDISFEHEQNRYAANGYQEEDVLEFDNDFNNDDDDDVLLLSD